jgi:zinc transporter ZupT
MTETTIPAGWLLAIYCLLVLLASLAGGWFLLILRPTHARLQLAISFVAGLMLGIALLHFLPDADDQLHSIDRTVAWMLGGFLAMFFLQRFFHFHHHDSPEGDPEDCCHEHGEHESHEHEHHAHTLADKSAKQLSWVGTALGMTLHSLLDGLALAASVEAGVHGHAKLAGLGVALVVILHKPFDAMAVSALMTASGSSRFSRHVLNGLCLPRRVLFWRKNSCARLASPITKPGTGARDARRARPSRRDCNSKSPARRATVFPARKIWSRNPSAASCCTFLATTNCSPPN